MPLSHSNYDKEKEELQLHGYGIISKPPSTNQGTKYGGYIPKPEAADPEKNATADHHKRYHVQLKRRP